MAKRRQQNPGKDFVKKKRKVGKAKIAPSSATKTAFVSCGIAVPTQLVVKSEHVPTTKRKLSFTVGACNTVCNYKLCRVVLIQLYVRIYHHMNGPGI